MFNYINEIKQDIKFQFNNSKFRENKKNLNLKERVLTFVILF